MAAKTPITDKTNDGYVDPFRGIRGFGGADVHADGTTINKEGLRHRVFFFPSLDNGDTWASGISGCVACAWQASTANGEGALFFSSEAARKTGDIAFITSTGNSEGWMHVWSKG